MDNTNTEPTPPQTVPEKPSGTEAPKRSRTALTIFAVLVSVLGIGVAFRLATSAHAHNDAVNNIVTVGVAKVQRHDVWRDVVFNAELQPYQEVDLHAKVAGYVKSITVDIGDAVREGDVIATLELPEVEADIERVIAAEKRSEEDVRRAEAAYEEAHVACKRIQAIHEAQPNLLAQQDVDTAVAKDRAAESGLAGAKLQVQVAQAEVKKLQTMLGYAKITAPFSGVVTKRYADKGALIQAGTTSSTQAMPLIRLSQNDRLRLVFPVSVSYVASMHVGDAVEVRVPSMASSLSLKITRLGGKVDPHTRTMDVEIDVPNADSRFVPGIYASVATRLDTKHGAVAVPVEALSPQARGSVFVVNGDTVEERTLQLGLETPTTVEAISGLKENELVMIGSRTGVKPGQKVAVKIIDTGREHSL